MKANMTKPHFHQTECALCGSTDRHDYEIVYPATYLQTEVESLFSARRLPDGIHSQIVRCLRDGQVRSTPVLENSVLSKLYRESEFTYQEEVTNLTQTYMNALEDVLPYLKASDKVLEIGCGSGFMLSALKARGFKNVYGVEPSQKAIDKADKFIQSRITQKLFSRKLYKEETFSFIFILQTLDHIPNPKEFLADCLAVLKPGGFILSYHHDVSSLSATLLGEKSPIFDIEHTYLYDHRTSCLLLEKNGFIVRKAYSPLNVLSLYHLAWLSPLPTLMKNFLLKENAFSKQMLHSIKVEIPLGNTCIIGQKPRSVPRSDKIV